VFPLQVGGGAIAVNVWSQWVGVDFIIPDISLMVVLS